MLGGAPLNFAYRMQERGNRAYPVSSLGADNLGDRAVRQLQALGLAARLRAISDERPTGTVPVTFGAERPARATHHAGCRLRCYPAVRPSSTPPASADCIYFGTLAQRGHESHRTLQHLLEAAPETGATRLRFESSPDCYTHATVLGSLDLAQIVKLSQRRDRHRWRDRRHRAKRADRRIRPQACWKVHVAGLRRDSRRERRVAVDENGATVDLPGIAIESIVDTVGAGDAFFAGFIDAILHGADLGDACRRGNVLGALATQKPGGTRQITRKRLMISAAIDLA